MNFNKFSNCSGLLTTFGSVQEGLFLRAVQPQAAPPAGIKTRAAVGGEESGA